jgi:hypothetical protein
VGPAYTISLPLSGSRLHDHFQPPKKTVTRLGSGAKASRVDDDYVGAGFLAEPVPETLSPEEMDRLLEGWDRSRPRLGAPAP